MSSSTSGANCLSGSTTSGPFEADMDSSTGLISQDADQNATLKTPCNTLHHSIVHMNGHPDTQLTEDEGEARNASRRRGRPSRKKCATRTMTWLFSLIALGLSVIGLITCITRFGQVHRVPQAALITNASFFDPSEPSYWIHAAIDIARVRPCNATKSKMPCRENALYITSEPRSVHPLKCVDASYLANPQRGKNNCDRIGQTFQLNSETGRIRVMKPGVYLIMTQITFRLREAAEVLFGVAVNDEQVAFLCSTNSPGITRSGRSAPFSHCSVQGMRRLEAGDEVWLFAPHSGVPLLGMYRSTFIQLALQHQYNPDM